MSDYLFNFVVIAGYAVSVVGASASLAMTIGEDRFRVGYFIAGSLLFVNFFAMAASDVVIRS